MTEKEALNYLKDANRNNQMFCILPKSDTGKCLIKSLEEVQMYHEGKLCLVPEDVFGKICEENDEYKEIGTVEECRAAVEKQKEMIAYCDENDCADCLFYNATKKYNKCMNDFIAEEIEKGGVVNE